MSVLSHLNNIGSKLVLTSSEKSSIRTSISTLSGRLDLYFDNIDEHFVFGSFDRGTILPRYVDENSDIDYMVVFEDGSNYTPQTLMNRLRRFVEKYYSRSEIHQSNPTIVLELNHIKFELVPAYKNWWDTLYIPAPSTDYQAWIYTNPDELKEDLQVKNRNNNFEIKKLVRILKYWNVLNNKVYSSYELERYIIDKTYWFCYNIKDYFYSAVSGLPTYDLPKYKEKKVERLINTIDNVKEYEYNDMPISAEIELKKEFPNI